MITVHISEVSEMTNESHPASQDEMKRLRQLVDNAQECDPRIKKFRDEAKALKEVSLFSPRGESLFRLR